MYVNYAAVVQLIATHGYVMVIEHVINNAQLTVAYMISASLA